MGIADNKDKKPDEVMLRNELEKMRERRKRQKLLILPFLVIMELFMAVMSMTRMWPGWAASVFIFSIILVFVYFFLAGRESIASRYMVLLVFWADLCLFSWFFEDTIAGLPLVILAAVLLSFFDDRTIEIINMIVTTAYLLIFSLVFGDYNGYPKYFAVLVFIAVLSIEILILENIRSRLDEEAAFSDTLDKLDDSQSAKDDFLANVSHELRTPLNTVVGVSEHLADQDVPKEMKRDVNDILTAGKNLMYMVSDIVDFTEIHSGKVFLTENVYSIKGILEDLINMTSFWNQEKNLELIFDCDPKICRTFKGDSQKIYRVLLCLSNNAIKFTSSGAVLVRIEGRKENDQENLLITIADTGRGMSSDEIQKLDAVYNQLDTTRSREEGGIGLGIPISEKLVEAMNGFMHIDSEKDKGTTITIVLPQAFTDPSPVLTVNEPENKAVLIYLDLSRYKNFKVRDWYMETIGHIIDGLSLKAFQCTSFAELKRRAETRSYTHIYTSSAEYRKKGNGSIVLPAGYMWLSYAALCMIMSLTCLQMSAE